MQKRRSKYFILVLSVFALLLTGVYAILGANLNITGTATGTGNFKVEFSSYNVSDEEKVTANINSDNTSITIDANLAYPGDSVTIDFVIKNTGNLAATVQNLVINENSTDDINITINGISSIQGTTLDVGETTSGSIVATWNESSTTSTPEMVTFNVTIDYIQAAQ